MCYLFLPWLFFTAVEDLVRSVALDEGKWRARYGFAKPRPDAHLIIYTTPEQKAKVLTSIVVLLCVATSTTLTNEHCRPTGHRDSGHPSPARLRQVRPLPVANPTLFTVVCCDPIEREVANNGRCAVVCNIPLTQPHPTRPCCRCGCVLVMVRLCVVVMVYRVSVYAGGAREWNKFETATTF